MVTCVAGTASEVGRADASSEVQVLAVVLHADASSAVVTACVVEAGAVLDA